MNLVHDLRGIDLNLLVAFGALYERRSVTATAQDLGVTQSAMSHTLKRLRQLTGDALFVRAGRTLAPTPRADAMIGPVRQALRALSVAVHEPEAFHPAASARTFTLATVDLFDLALLPRLTRHLRAAGPRVGLTIRTHGRATVEALHRGAIDAAIHPVLAGPDPLPASGLVRRTLFREPFRLYARDHHPHDLSTLDGYCAADHLVVSPDGSGPTLVDRHLTEHHRARRVAMRLPQFAASLTLVAHTDLILTGPAMLATLVPEGVDVLPLPFDLPDHAITMLWSERFSDDPGHRWLREGIVAACGR